MKLKVPSFIDKKESNLFQILFGVLSGVGLYSLAGLILLFLVKYINLLAVNFGFVFLIFYIILFLLTYAVIKYHKLFRWSYLISSLILILIYVFTTLIPQR